MPLGIQNITQITQQNITDITNVTGFSELMININHSIFNGYLYFVLLWVLWIILFVAAQERENSPLINAMYSGAGVTIVSFFLRAILVVEEGVEIGLLSESQMWIFPILTVVLALFNYMTKQN